MLELRTVALDDVATALSDQADYETCWLIDPRSGEVAFWTAELGVDGENTTGAVRLYERAGMHVTRRYDTWELRR